MLEKALTGSRRYGIWVAILLALFGMGVISSTSASWITAWASPA